jgi:hypothetical protein
MALSKRYQSSSVSFCAIHQIIGNCVVSKICLLAGTHYGAEARNPSSVEMSAENPAPCDIPKLIIGVFAPSTPRLLNTFKIVKIFCISTFCEPTEVLLHVLFTRSLLSVANMPYPCATAYSLKSRFSTLASVHDFAFPPAPW